MAQGVLDILGEHMYATETGEWEQFSHLQFRTVTTRDLHPSECDIGGKPYTFKQGEEVWAPANVRLVLEEAGYLANPDEHSFRVE